MNKAASPYKAVVLLGHTIALLGDLFWIWYGGDGVLREGRSDSPVLVRRVQGEARATIQLPQVR